MYLFHCSFTTVMRNIFQTFNFQVKNVINNTVDIYIDGDIVDAETQGWLREWYGDDTSVSYKSFRDQITSVEASTFNVYINSYGGLVTDAMAIHDLLKDMQAKGKTVNTRGRGIIASAATYILMAGNAPEMSKNSWFMIHNVSGAAWGNVNQIEQYAATLRQFNDAARDFYSTATGLSKEEIEKLMDAESWFTADEAKNKGFIKQVTGEVNFTNSISRENWMFSNMAVLNAYNSAVKTAPPQPSNETHLSIKQELEEMKKFFQDLGNSIMNAVKGVKAPENSDHQSLMTSIGEAISAPINQIGEQLDQSVNEAVGAAVTNQVPEAVNTAVTNALSGEAFTNAVNAAVQNATSALTQRLTELETANEELKKKNEELEQDIINKIGKPSNSGNPETPAPIGQFKK